MAGRFGELDEYFSPGLTLTVLRREYTLPLPSGELGLWCRRIAQMAGEVSEASTEDELQEAGKRAREQAEDLPPIPGAGKLSFERLLLGVVLDQMLADGVPDAYIQFCAQTAYIWIVAGEASAERYWVAGGRPEALSPTNREERRAGARMTATAAAGATPSAASTSGTSSPTRSRRSGRGGGSRGRRS